MTHSYIRDLQEKAEKALKKAVAKALLRHQQAGIPAVIWQNGRVVEIPIHSRKSPRRKK
jgi:hypothetical protein